MSEMPKVARHYKTIIVTDSVFETINNIRKFLKSRGISATHSEILKICMTQQSRQAGGAFGIYCELKSD